jgi:uncharacterized protein
MTTKPQTNSKERRPHFSCLAGFPYPRPLFLIAPAFTDRARNTLQPLEFRDKNPHIHYSADPGSPKMNQQQALADPVLTRFRDAVRARYGDRLVRIVFFGSRVRGDHRPDSDYDIAVFLNDYDSLRTELDPLSAITTDILSDTGAVISAKPFRADSYKAQTLFMGELRREGIDL